MEQANAIGEGVLSDTDSSNSDDYYVDEDGNKHKWNDYSKLMSAFNSMTRAG